MSKAKIILSIIMLLFSKTSIACLSKEAVPFELTEKTLATIGASSLLNSYDLINTHWKYASEPSKFKTTSELWESTPVCTSSGKTAYFRWKYDNQPNIILALNDILSSETFSECMNAGKIAKIKLLADLMGNEIMEDFVEQVKAKYAPSGEFAIFHTLSWAFQTPCNEDFEGIYSKAFVNIPEYMDFKPEGDAGNHNVEKLPNGKFVGFDPDFFTTPKTYDELEQYMYDAFLSEEFVAEDQVEKHSAFCKSLSFESFKKKRQVYQSNFPPYRFDLEKLNRFIGTGGL